MAQPMDVRSWEDPHRREPAYEGITRRVLAFTDDLMLVHYTVEADAVFPAHTHEATHQAVFVVEGEVELLGERTGRLAAGDSFVVGPGVEHGIRGVAPESRLVDAFAPPLDRYAD